MIQSGMEEALHYYELGRYEQAISIFSNLLADDPNNSELLSLTAEAYFQLDRFDIAEQYAIESLEKGCTAEQGNYLLARIYIETAQYAISEKCFLEALRINPSNAPVLSSYGILMLRTGHEKKAMQLIDEAMRIAPEHPNVLRHKLFYHLYMENKKEQIKALERVVQSTSKEMAKILSIGFYHLNNKKYKQAREQFRQAFVLDPTNEYVLEILQDLDRISHPLFFFNRIVDKYGAHVIWLTFILIAIVLKLLNQNQILLIVVLVYITFAVLTWVMPLVYRLFKRD